MDRILLLSLVLAAFPARASASGSGKEIDRRLEALQAQAASIDADLQRLKDVQKGYLEDVDPRPAFVERDRLRRSLQDRIGRFYREFDDVDDLRRKQDLAGMLSFPGRIKGRMASSQALSSELMVYQRRESAVTGLNDWRQRVADDLNRETQAFALAQEGWRRKRLLLWLLGALAALVAVGVVPAVRSWRRRSELAGYQPGSLVARQYRVLAKAGLQALGPLYEAEDVELRRPVWLQAFHPDILDDRALLERVVEGTRLAARLRHPNILEIYTVALEGGRAALILERGPAASLESWLERGTRLSPAAAARLFAQAAEALAYAHAQGIAHGALEPGSMLIGQDGGVKLKDFVYGRLARRARGLAPSPAEDVRALRELFRRTVGALPASLEPRRSARALAEALRKL